MSDTAVWGLSCFSVFDVFYFNLYPVSSCLSSGRYLVSGNHDGTVSVWDTTQAPTTVPDSQDPVLEPVLNYKAHDDTVNGAR